MTDAKKEEEDARSRAGLVAIVVTGVLLLALAILQIVNPVNWSFWIAIAAGVLLLAWAIRARRANRRRTREQR